MGNDARCKNQLVANMSIILFKKRTFVKPENPMWENGFV